jgi:RNA polymerase sigma-70 factor (ECF subfamily)
MENENESNQNKVEREFLEAYDMLSEKILRHINFRISDHDEAEEILSETFLKTWKYISEGHEVDSLKSFLYRVANNLIIDHYRSKSKAALPLDEAIGIEAWDSADPEDRLDRKIESERVEKALGLLPERYRQLLVYRYIDELSVAEISQATGKSSVNIYVTIHRALKALKTIIESGTITGKGNRK